MCVVVEAGHLLGVFTDGDLRRVLDRESNVHKTTMREVMTSPGKRVTATELAAEAAHLMEKHRITALPVVDAQGALVGALNVHDLLRAGCCELPAPVQMALTRVRLLVLDVDGVLTDGRLFMARGELLKVSMCATVTASSRSPRPASPSPSSPGASPPP